MSRADRPALGNVARKENRIRLIPGILALLGCVALAWEGVRAYLRHPDDSGSVGFVFITIFLIFWCLPMTAVIIQIGADSVASRESERRRRVMLKIDETALVSGAGFFLAYGLWLGALSLGHATMPMFELLFDSALILIFAANVFGCAVKVRSNPGAPEVGSRWMTAVLLAAAALVTSHLIAVVSSGFQSGLLPFVAPAAVWLAVLAWSVRRWRRSRIPARVERGNRSEVS